MKRLPTRGCVTLRSTATPRSIALRCCVVRRALAPRYALTFGYYFNDPLYASKKPSEENPLGDNIYEPLDIGRFRQLSSSCHDSRHHDHDLSVNRVLISQEFYYFGSKAPRLPAECEPVVRSTQAHLRIRGDKHDNRYRAFLTLLEWLERQPSGILAPPSLDEIVCPPPRKTVAIEARVRAASLGLRKTYGPAGKTRGPWLLSLSVRPR